MLLTHRIWKKQNRLRTILFLRIHQNDMIATCKFIQNLSVRTSWENSSNLLHEIPSLVKNLFAKERTKRLPALVRMIEVGCLVPLVFSSPGDNSSTYFFDRQMRIDPQRWLLPNYWPRQCYGGFELQQRPQPHEFCDRETAWRSIELSAEGSPWEPQYFFEVRAFPRTNPSS